MASLVEVDEKDVLDPQNLEDLYSWIDAAPLTRPKKHIARDFSDGVSVAEIVHFYLPRMIDLHNYVNANSTSQKRINWNMLNRKVFVKLNLKLNDKIIENVIEAKPGAIEQVVWDLRKKISEVSPKSITRSNTSSHIQKRKSSIPVVGINKLGKKVPSEAVTSAQSARIPAKPQQSLGGKLASVPSGSKGAERPQQDGSSYTAGLKDELYQFGRNVSNSAGVEGGERPRVSESVSAGSGVDVNANNPDSPSLPPAHLIYKGHKMVPSMLLEVKNKQIRDLQLVVNGLQKKVTFLDNLIQLKDNRVEDLSQQLHSMRSKFQELTQTKLPDL